MLTKRDFVKKILKERKPVISGYAEKFAPSNIALCKYWGKRDTILNLPVTDSLSVSLGKWGTTTSIRISGEKEDRVIFNGRVLDKNSEFASKVLSFSNLLKPDPGISIEIRTENNIPTAAGSASSASGFAALTKALDAFFGYDLEEKELSLIAGLGSGSASRSIYSGFVRRNRGSAEDGTDSFSVKLPYIWKELRVGLVDITEDKKSVSSREGMEHTVKTSLLYRSWPDQAERDLSLILEGIKKKDFETLGRRAENNSMAMHACMLASDPPLLYWEPETVKTIKKVFSLRKEGMPLYLTMDAGANVKLLFEKETEEDVKENFPEIKIAVPFI